MPVLVPRAEIAARHGPASGTGMAQARGVTGRAGSVPCFFGLGPARLANYNQKLLGRGIDARGTGKTPRTQHGMVGGTTSEEQVWALGGAAAALLRARVFWAN